jgi:hypothetical protein
MESKLPETIEEINDIWEEKLKIELENLQVCQKSNNLDSCFNCEKIFDCTIRGMYVKAVYESMNKGHGGGFEF